MKDSQKSGLWQAWLGAISGIEVLLALIVFAVPDFRAFLQTHSWPWAWLAVAILLPATVGFGRLAQDQRNLLRTPDPVDVEQFRLFRELIPESGDTVEFLSQFDGKRWKGSKLSPLEKADRNWEHWTFENEPIADAFTTFQQTQAAFQQWTTREGAPDERADSSTDLYSIYMDLPHQKTDSVRKEGMKLADELLESIRRVHVVGRKEGLRGAALQQSKG